MQLKMCQEKIKGYIVFTGLNGHQLSHKIEK